MKSFTYLEVGYTDVCIESGMDEALGIVRIGRVAILDADVVIAAREVKDIILLSVR